MKHFSTTTLISILFIMIIISAYFSASETGMMTLNRYRLNHKVKQGHRGAYRIAKLLRQPDKLISLVLIGNNIANIVASALGTLIGLRLYGDTGVAVATGLLTFVLLIFAEMLPKTYAALYPEKIAFPCSLLLSPLQKIMSPLVSLLNGITHMLLHICGIHSFFHTGDAVSKEELRTIVNESHSLISRRHQDMLISILDLETVTVDDIMVPQNEIVGIDITDDWKVILRQLIHSPHGRIVLYRGSLDDAIGMLRLRKAYQLMMERQEFNKENLLRAADEIYYIPENTPLNSQLLRFQHNKEKVGLVVDEYGDIKGLISVEDILEEIVGDFTTSISPSLSQEAIPQNDGSVLIEGTANIRELNKSFSWHLPADGARTMNGLLLEELEEIPEVGVQVVISDYSIKILAVKNNRITKVRVQPLIR